MVILLNFGKVAPSPSRTALDPAPALVCIAPPSRLFSSPRTCHVSAARPSRFVVFITGATSGFGAATARRYAAAGARIVATGRREDRLDALQQELGADRCHVIALDVRDRAAMEAAIAAIPAPFDAINVVVANAGLALGLQPAAEADLDDWQTMIDTNVSGLVYTVRLLLPGLIARGGGHVVTLGSVAGEYAYPGGSVYAASKAFVKHFALAIRSDLQGKNVRVTDIEPGLTETEFSVVRFKGDEQKAAMSMPAPRR